MEKMKVFAHQLYECKKGVRCAALCTLSVDCKERAIKKLQADNMSYFISPISSRRINLFFGEQVCIDVVKRFCHKPLNQLSPEEDFILGSILGYGICEQCRRYDRMNAKLQKEPLVA